MATLETNGSTVTRTVASLATYDRIVTRNTPEAQNEAVSLALSSTGKLDLTVPLEGQRAVSITASGKGNEIIGGAKDDTLYGGAGNDTLDGGAGNDTIFDGNGTADRDSLIGGSGNDTITSYAGIDTIQGGAGDDRIYLGYSTDRAAIVDGGADRDVLSGVYDLTKLTISNVEVLEGNSFTATAAQLATFSRIVASDAGSNETDTINIQLSGSGKIDLTAQLEGKRAASVTASAAGNEIVTGVTNDTLQGGVGADTLDGGAGADTIYDGNGTTDRDSLIGGAGNDTIYSYAGADTIRGGEGEDRIYLFNSTDRALTIDGGADRDVLFGAQDLTKLTLSNVEVLEGNNFALTAAQLASVSRIVASDAGNNETDPIYLYLSGAGKADVTAPLEGKRAAYVAASADGNEIVAGVTNDTLQGGVGADTLDGGAGADTLYDGNGTVDKDSLIGGAGNDTIYSYAGADTIRGGEGEDRIYLFNSTDRAVVVDGGADRDVLSGAQDLTKLTISNVEVLEGNSVTLTTSQLAGFSRIVASDAGNNETDAIYLYLSGAGKADVTAPLEGKRAAYVVASADGNEIVAGVTNDTLQGGVGADTLDGGAGADTLYDGNGTTDRDSLIGGAGNDTIYSYAGADTIRGGDGSDRIYLFNSTDRAVVVDGGADRDVLSGAQDLTKLTISNVEVLEGNSFTLTAAQIAGFSRIVASDAGNNETDPIYLYLSGAGKADLSTQLEGKRAAYVVASTDGNEIVGGAKNDTLYGGVGADTLNGGAGSDLIDGGEGTDTAVFGKAFSAYSIKPGQSGSGTFTVIGEGTDSLANVEVARFTDGTYDFRTGKFTPTATTQTLVTDGRTVSGTVAEFASYDVIRGSATDPNAGVSLKVTDGGALDLSAKLGDRAAILEGSAAGNTFTTGGGNDRLIQSLDALNSGATTIFKGGAGIDTLELSAGPGATGPIVASVLSDGSVSFAMNGRTVVAGPDVERLVVSGSGFGDQLVGSGGNDWLDGRGGDDTFTGSAGNDGYVFDTAGDKVVGELANGGTDTIFTTVSVDLGQHANVENLRLQSGDINGTGNGLANLITGTGGRNVIAGGAGNDSLYGKGGADVFVFAEKGSANRDTIWDFDSDDMIRLNKSVFTGFASTGGALDATDLSLSGKATAAHAQVIYNTLTGVLSYDADGTGAAKAEDIAFIGKGLKFLDSADILLV